MHPIQETFKTCLLFFLCIVAAATIQAQGYEIRTTNKGLGLIGVEMRVTSAPAPGTADMITDILFGIKWSSSYNVDLAATFTSLYNIRKSGTRMLRNGYHYQTFYAESVPFSVPLNWGVNNWTEILSISNNRTGAGTGLFEIVEYGFDPTADANIGINLVDHTPMIAGTAIGIPLPVRLTSFEALPGTGTVMLQWAAENEQNSKGFEVQRAESGDLRFNKIGWIDSRIKNAGTNQYEFVDKDVAAQVKYSYRLNQVDNDGRSVYSPLKTILLNGSYKAPVNMLPNPVDGMLNVVFNSPVSDQVMLQIVDAKGAVVQTRKEYPKAGQKVELNTSNLIRGQYFLVVQHQDGSVFFSRSFQKR